MSKLLIIEDNYDLILLYMTAFQMKGITPDVANTGPAAIRYIENKPPADMVILDLHLKKEGNQEVTGGDVFVVLRRKWPRTKVAVVSADMDWSHNFEGVADAVIDKPIRDMIVFVDQIKRFM